MTTAAPGSDTTVSPPAQYTDEPPRICVCINEALIGDDRKDEPLLTDEMIFSVAGADYVQNVAKWVVDLLEGDAFSKVWDAPAGRKDDWPVDKQPLEEAWAKQMDAMFLGASYAGPDIVADFPGHGPYGGKPQAWIYKRVQASYLPLGDTSKFIDDPYDGVSPIDNDDPAYSIAVACQHLSTYGALCRGLSFETDLSNVGIPASQAAGGLHIFDDDANPKGTWMGTVARVKPGAKADGTAAVATISDGEAHNAEAATKKLPDYGPGTIYTYNPYGDQKFRIVEVSEDMLYRKVEKDGVERVQIENDIPLIDPKLAIKIQVKAAEDTKADDKTSKDNATATNAVVKALTGIDPNFKGETHDVVNEGIQYRCPSCGELHPASTTECPKNHVPIDFSGKSKRTAHLPLNAQVDGSHIGMVLRKFTFRSGPSKGKVGIQLLDTSAKTQRATRTKEDKARFAEEYLMWSRLSSYQGIFAAEGMASIQRYEGKGKFVGCGSLPAITNADQITFLQQIRPVGFARLLIAVSEHGDPKAPWKGKTISDNDVLFLSRMVKMWGSDKTANYYISRYLLSLRNTPNHKNLQAYWLIFAPRGELAEVMWEKGSRDLSVDAMIAKAVELRATYNEKRSDKEKKSKDMITGVDLAPIAVLTHGDQGHAYEVWRNHCLVGGGQGSPPKGIKDLFISPAFPVIRQQEKSTVPDWLANAVQADFDPDRPKVSDIPSIHRNPLASYVHPSLYDATSGAGLTLPDYLKAETAPAAAAPESKP